MKSRPILLRAIRLAAWLSAVMLGVLAVVPPPLRPESHFPSELEHFAGFFVAGGLHCVGYHTRLAEFLIIAITFAAAIELLQIPLPGQRARLTDFFIDAIGACAGSGAAFLLVSTGLLRLQERDGLWSSCHPELHCSGVPKSQPVELAFRVWSAAFSAAPP